MALKVDSFHGLIIDTNPVVIAKIPDDMNVSIGITLITLYNPNSTAVPFLLRKFVKIADDEIFYIRKDKSISAKDDWEWGTLRHIPLSDPEHYYDVKLDSNPPNGKPIEFVVDWVFEQ